MKTPEIPANEQTRLNNLRSLNILDTTNEERFDRLTRLAQHIFDVPIAVVSLVDENRQWFKSCMGLNAKETPRDVSFCGHAILNKGNFVIPDATQDERFADNPLVVGAPFIRFYAGCPLRFFDDTQLGTLCIIDTKPRDFDEQQLSALTDLAELAERELVAMHLATRDELTQIFNRRNFINLSQKSLDLCARKNLPVTLVFMDLNKFKSINDTYGHAEGDKALINFANVMQNTFRDADVIARYAGDEFVVLLTDTTFNSAEDIMSRFQQNVDEYNNEKQRGYDIEFCYGMISTEDTADYDIEALLHKADSELYKQKNKLA